MKDLDDATQMRKRIVLGFERAEMAPDRDARSTQLTYVMVGGGPTGMELAGALAELPHRALAASWT